MKHEGTLARAGRASQVGRSVVGSHGHGAGEMSKPLILVTMCIYFYVGAEQGLKGNFAGLILWSSYGVANIGLWLMTE